MTLNFSLLSFLSHLLDVKAVQQMNNFFLRFTNGWMQCNRKVLVLLNHFHKISSSLRNVFSTLYLAIRSCKCFSVDNIFYWILSKMSCCCSLSKRSSLFSTTTLENSTCSIMSSAIVPWISPSSNVYIQYQFDISLARVSVSKLHRI